MTISISMITVAWNSAATIQDTVKSVNAQTHPDVEHILVDGASSDDTVQRFRDLTSRQHVVISECDSGIYDAMNKGLRSASGTIIGFINSDDYLAGPSVLSQVARCFADPKIDVVFGDLAYVRKDRPDTVIRLWKPGNPKPYPFRDGWIPPHPTFFMRTSAYARLGGYDTRFAIAADYDLMFRALRNASITAKYLPQTLVRMRLGGASNANFGNRVQGNQEIHESLGITGRPVDIVRFTVGRALRYVRQLRAGIFSSTSKLAQ